MHINKDIIIFGGGIAGLWLIDRLRTLGYDAVLLEHKALGSGQSIASQGMIHGGMKYALGGQLTGAANAIADMPAWWRRCLAGKGDVDLRGTRVLSEAYYLWPRESLRSRLNAFLGSKAVRGRVDAVDATEMPAFLRGRIQGPLYRLQDIVLDVPSLLHTLATRHSAVIHKVDWQSARLLGSPEGIDAIELPGGERLQARCHVCTSGEGAAWFLASLGVRNVVMQRRPLNMVIVKHRIPDPLFLHLVSERMSTTPELTITTHRCSDGRVAWYLGGGLAESGVERSPAQQLECARKLLAERFPWYDLKDSEMYCYPVNRAEASQPGGKRPDNASVQQEGNVLYAWPTKLTLAPQLAQQVIERLQAAGITPGSHGNHMPLHTLPTPPLAQPPWEQVS